MLMAKKATGLRLLPYGILAALTVVIGLVGPLVSEFLSSAFTSYYANLGLEVASRNTHSCFGAQRLKLRNRSCSCIHRNDTSSAQSPHTYSTLTATSNPEKHTSQNWHTQKTLQFPLEPLVHQRILHSKPSLNPQISLASLFNATSKTHLTTASTLASLKASNA